MDEYAREMMDLKTLVTRTLEKRGVLARIRAELRANIFAAIEEEDRSMENEENPTFALLGTCSQRAKDLHASPTGKVLTALVCDYLEWCQLEHTLKVYLPECNLPRGFWKSELKDKFGEKADDTGSSKDNELPLLASIVESYLKHEQQNAVSNITGSFTKLGVRRMQNDNVTTSTPTDDAQNDAEKVNPARRPSSASVGGSLSVGRKGGLAPIGQTRSSAISSRNLEVSSANDRLGGEEPVVLNEIRRAKMNLVDNNGAANKISGRKLSGGSENDCVITNPEAAISVDLRQENQSERKVQSINSLWRQKTSIGLQDDASVESVEEIVEEDASFDKESCSSVHRDSLEDLL